MKCKTCLFLLAIVGILLLSNQTKAQNEESQAPAEKLEIPNNEKLVIVWTSGDRDVALKMVFMYTFNSKKFKWWDDITLVVWGPSAKLLSEDKELQDYITKILDAGIVLKACKACADQYGISEKLEELGINVKCMGRELTDYIKEGRHVLTF